MRVEEVYECGGRCALHPVQPNKMARCRDMIAGTLSYAGTLSVSKAKQSNPQDSLCRQNSFDYIIWHLQAQTCNLRDQLSVILVYVIQS